MRPRSTKRSRDSANSTAIPTAAFLPKSSSRKANRARKALAAKKLAHVVSGSKTGSKARKIAKPEHGKNPAAHRCRSKTGFSRAASAAKAVRQCKDRSKTSRHKASKGAALSASRNSNRKITKVLPIKARKASKGRALSTSRNSSRQISKVRAIKAHKGDRSHSSSKGRATKGRTKDHRARISLRRIFVSRFSSTHRQDCRRSAKATFGASCCTPNCPWTICPPRACLSTAAGEIFDIAPKTLPAQYPPFMWKARRRRKRWYRRLWFTIPFWTLLILGIVGGVLFMKMKADYESKARRFDYTRLEAMESASIILDRTGVVMGRIFTQNREQVTFDELSPALITAVIGAEDTRFREHAGVDYKGVARAVYENWRAGYNRQGASTLTQQLARNTFPEQLPPSDRTRERKILEMFVAREIEQRCTKDKILELYLNRVYFGSGFYGAEAAARGYFGKSAKELSISEGSMLAAVLRSPNKLAPWENYSTCISERNRVLNRMLESKLISREDYDVAYNDEPLLKNKRSVHQENFAADMIHQQVLKLVGKDRALGDGLKIHTTIDWALQKKSEELLRGQLLSIERREGYEHGTYADFDAKFEAAKGKLVDTDGKKVAPEYLQGSVVVLNNTDGGILTIVGGRDFAHSQLNRATQVALPPGTAFKPLVYAAAFEKGLFPGTAVNDAVMDNTRVMIGGTTGFLGEWGPEISDNRFEGIISARTALVKSKNAATVRLGMMTGIKDVLTLADKAGISDELAAYPKTYLGGSEVTPMDLTLSYVMFAKSGTRPVEPYVIKRIEDKDGAVLFSETPETEQVIKATTAYEVHTCLADVLERGTAERANSDLGLKKYPLGGKTGTAYNFTDLWFVGYSSEVTASVWIGFDQQRGKPKRSIYRGAFSKDLALPVWAEIIKSTVATYPPQPIQQPPGIIRCEICAHSGELATDKCLADGIRTTYHEICTEAQAPKNPCPIHTGLVAGTSSPAGTSTPADPKAPPKPKVFMDTEHFKSITMKEPTVIGVDPYNSAGAVDRIKSIAGVGNAVAPISTQNEVPVADPTQPVAAPLIPQAKILGPSTRTDTKLAEPERLKFQ